MGETHTIAVVAILPFASATPEARTSVIALMALGVIVAPNANKF